jgi:Tol biopolymer transport system component
VRLNTPLGEFRQIRYPFLISPDSSRIVYRGDQDSADIAELFSVPLDGSAAPTRLYPSTARAEALEISADSSTVLFSADLDGLDGDELLAVPLDGTALPTTLALPTSSKNTIKSDAALVDGAGRVIYRLDAFQPTELYSIPLDASQPAIVLNDPLALSTAMDVAGFALTPDGSTALYVVDGVGSDPKGLFGVALEPLGSAALISQPDVPVSSSKLFFSADSSTVYYNAGNDGLLLYRAPVDGSSAPVLLSPHALGAGASIDGVLAPDESLVAYDVVFGSPAGLKDGPFTVPADGSGTPVDIHDAPDSNRGIVGFSADSSRVVYTSATLGFSHYRLWSAAADGVSPPLELTPTPAPELRLILSRALTPDRSKVIYVSELGTPSPGQLFPIQGRLLAVPVDGSTAEVELSGALPQTATVGRRFMVTADSTGVLFVSDRSTAGVFELFITPIDASHAPVRLSGTMVSGGDVKGTHFLLSPDGARAVYLADQETDEVFELFAAPIDGSATPIKLNGALVSGGHVSSFAISPDGSRVVYRADQDINEVFEYYSAPIDGSSAPTKLHAPLSGQRDVEPGLVFTCAPDRAVLFRADALVNNRLELWRAPLAGGVARRLGTEPPPGGAVQPGFIVPPGGDQAYYRGDLNTLGVFELFRTDLRPTRLRGVDSPATAPPRMVDPGP